MSLFFDDVARRVYIRMFIDFKFIVLFSNYKHENRTIETIAIYSVHRILDQHVWALIYPPFPAHPLNVLVLYASMADHCPCIKLESQVVVL